MHLFSEIKQTEREYYDLYQNPDFQEHYDKYVRDGMAQAFKEHVKPHLIIEKDGSRLLTYRTEIFVLSRPQMKRIVELIEEMRDLSVGSYGSQAEDMRQEILGIIKATTLEDKANAES